MRTRLKDESGKRYGRLLVLYRGKNVGTRAAWVCRCDCGKEALVTGPHLRSGASTTCGCGRWVGLVNYNSLPAGVGAQNKAVGKMRANALARGLSWNISTKEAVVLCEKDCFYCWSPPSMVERRGKSTGEWRRNGIDRVDNTRGYDPDNVVPCCPDCNRAKLVMTLEKFESWIERVHFCLSIRKAS